MDGTDPEGGQALVPLARRLEAVGFRLLGGFHTDANCRAGEADCDCPPAPGGGPAATLILVGNAGDALWRAFSAAPEACDGAPDPLDRYTRRTLQPIARHAGLAAVFPFEKPWWPFQRWALAAGGFSPSPMGVLAHHRYGPWAGFRAAFVSADRLGDFPENGLPGPCPTCADKPCIAACPPKALSPAGYDVPRCLAHLGEPADAVCLSGCLARIACPFGEIYRHAPAQARFHMRAFTGWCDTSVNKGP